MADTTVTMESLNSKVDALTKDMKAMNRLLRKIRTHQEDPDGEKAKARAVNNGFNRPLEVSEKLRVFLGLGEDETISRSAVTKAINQYVTDNGLKHPDNGRRIVLDDKLTDLLQPPSDTEITFLNIQKYLSPHYTKPTAKTDVEVTSSDTVSEKKSKRPTVRKSKA